MRKKPIYIVLILGIFLFNLPLKSGVVWIKKFFNASDQNSLIKIFNYGQVKREVAIPAYNSADIEFPVPWIEYDNMREPSMNYCWIQTKAGIYNILQGDPFWQHFPRPSFQYWNGDGVYLRGPGYDNIQKINEPTQGSNFSLLVDQNGILKKANLNNNGQCEDFKFKFGFLAISDTHYTDDPNFALYPEMREKVKLVPAMIESTKSTFNVKAVLMSGDLADKNQNDTVGEKSTKKFEEDWYNPLKNSLNAVNGKGVFFVPGNHDWDTRGVEGVWPYKYPYIIEFLLKTIDNQLGKDDYYYSFDIGNVHFACPGIYPADDEGNPMEWVAALLYGKKRLYVNRGSLEWLKNDLKNHTYPGQPIIIFFHYTLTGFASGGSKKSEKDAFENLIKDNNYNVKAIINGHSHFNDSNFWRGIWQINVSGDKFALITYDPNNDELKMGFVNEYGNFVNKNGDAIGEPQPKPTGIADGEEQHAPEDSPTNGI